MLSFTLFASPIIKTVAEPQYLLPTPQDYLSYPEDYICFGGEITAPMLFDAYQKGLFPWFNPDEEIVWWSPNPRCVIYPKDFKLSNSLKRTIKKNDYVITINQCFERVMRACSAPRSYEKNTWIGEDIIAGYTELFEHGHAYSIEVWQPNQSLIIDENSLTFTEFDASQAELIGGLYGVSIGKMLFGESMFHTQTDASKIAFAFLMNLAKQRQIEMIDCQVENTHLVSLGATILSRQQYIQTTQLQCNQPSINWQSLSIQGHKARCLL